MNNCTRPGARSIPGRGWHATRHVVRRILLTVASRHEARHFSGTSHHGTGRATQCSRGSGSTGSERGSERHACRPYTETILAGRDACQRGRSVSRVLYRPTPERRSVTVIHLRPPVTRRLMRPTRGLGSAPLPRPVARRGLRPPIWPCSGWSLPVSLRRPARRWAAASSLWHWSSSRDGRELPATLRCGARTFLTASLRVTPTGAARPSDRLADRWILPVGRLDPSARAR